jgi:hypothetical protein
MARGGEMITQPSSSLAATEAFFFGVVAGAMGRFSFLRLPTRVAMSREFIWAPPARRGGRQGVIPR